ncbi:hypothetical protein Fmac_011098 [Flemingia macrophylla]|uniref:Uncharacterized protein n=1 Tax=Flemingia macrophylla TaxID=520843 RepID=A0ABD1MLG6_9FABA
MAAPVAMEVSVSGGKSSFVVSFYLPEVNQANPPSTNSVNVQRWKTTYTAVREFGGFVIVVVVAKQVAALNASIVGEPVLKVTFKTDSPTIDFKSLQKIFIFPPSVLIPLLPKKPLSLDSKHTRKPTSPPSLPMTQEEAPLPLPLTPPATQTHEPPSTHPATLPHPQRTQQPTPSPRHNNSSGAPPPPPPRWRSSPPRARDATTTSPGSYDASSASPPATQQQRGHLPTRGRCNNSLPPLSRPDVAAAGPRPRDTAIIPPPAQDATHLPTTSRTNPPLSAMHLPATQTGAHFATVRTVAKRKLRRLPNRRKVGRHQRILRRLTKPLHKPS